MTPQDIAVFLHSELGHRVVATVAVILLTVVIRALILRRVQRSKRISTIDRLRWRTHARSTSGVLLVLSLAFIWGSEVRDLLVSLVVLASALVLATKELLMCVSGSLLRASTRAFEIGDRIEIDGIRGDVIDLGILGTTLLEIGPGHQRTGRTQVVPNSVFLAKALANETFTERYVLHTFSVPVLPGEDWRESERRLLEVAGSACAEHVEEARRHMDAASKRHSLSGFDVDPRVTVHPEAQGEVWLRLRVPTPARERGRVEQEILRGYLGEDPRDPNEPRPAARSFV